MISHNTQCAETFSFTKNKKSFKNQDFKVDFINHMILISNSNIDNIIELIFTKRMSLNF